MQQVELTNRQISTANIFKDTEAVKAVEEHRWNVGDSGEDRVIKSTYATPTVIAEILHTYLANNGKVILPEGVVDKKRIVRTNLKKPLFSAAAEKLEKDEALLPDGTVVSVDEIQE